MYSELIKAIFISISFIAIIPIRNVIRFDDCHFLYVVLFLSLNVAIHIRHTWFSTYTY